MTQKRFVETTATLVIASILIVAGCSKKSNGPSKLSYSNDLNQLRDRFNADKGNVRLLLILSPT